jgi:hypothetical protein
VTKNISIAFELYQKVCAERDRELFLSTIFGNKPPSILDKYERPKCPDCKANMGIRVLPNNEEGVKTQLVCSNPKCTTVLSSDQDLDWWMSQLKRKKI